MALRVINHYPAINAVDIPKNASIKVVFNSGIIPQSVTAQTFSVNDASTYTTKVGTVGVEYDSSGVCTTAVFQPYVSVNGIDVVTPFTANTKYRVYLFNSPNSILSVGNEYLTTAYTFEFVTGTGLLSEDDPAGIPSGEYPDETPATDEIINADIIASGFRVTEEYPVNTTTNVATNIGTVTIKFNTDILTTGQEMSGYLSLDVKDVLY